MACFLGAAPTVLPSWVFPGGRIELGEDAKAAAVREVLEETGLRIHTTGVIGSREHSATGVPITYIAVVPVRSQEVISSGQELTELRWVTLRSRAVDGRLPVQRCANTLSAPWDRRAADAGRFRLAIRTAWTGP